MVIKRHFRFNSSDNVHKIHGILWKPDDQEIIGVVQLVHGMAEHIDRYDDFARFLCHHGFVVAGEDHLGHGKTVLHKGEYGFFAAKSGSEYVIKDNYRLKKHLEKEFEGLPYIILGHSMGSFIARCLVHRYNNEIDAAIFMGTGSQPAVALLVGKALTTLLSLVKGPEYVSPLVTGMATGAYNKRFRPARTESDWLSKDVDMVDKFVDDEMCGFTFTVSAFHDLFQFLDEAEDKTAMRDIRSDIPVLLISGEDDPVGDFSRGVKSVYERLSSSGLEKLTMKLYPGDRHEILNEINRLEVYHDILQWVKDIPELFKTE